MNCFKLVNPFYRQAQVINTDVKGTGIRAQTQVYVNGTLPDTTQLFVNSEWKVIRERLLPARFNSTPKA